MSHIGTSNPQSTTSWIGVPFPENLEKNTHGDVRTSNVAQEVFEFIETSLAGAVSSELHPSQKRKRSENDQEGTGNKKRRVNTDKWKSIQKLINDCFSENQVLDELKKVYFDAAGETNAQEAKEIIEALERFKEFDKNWMNELGQNALHVAASRGDLELVQFFIKEIGMHQDLLDKENGSNALHYAAQNGCLEVVKFFIEKCGMNPNVPNKCGSNSLHFAAESGNLDLVKFLIETMKMDKDLPDNDGETALHFATGHFYVIKYLGQGIENEKLIQMIHKTYFVVVEEVTDIENAKKIIKEMEMIEGFDKNFKGEGGSTALHVASGVGTLEMVQFLVKDMNLDMKKVDNEQKNALYYAIKWNRLETVRFFIEEMGMGKEKLRAIGSDALQYPLKVNNFELVKYLIDPINLLPYPDEVIYSFIRSLKEYDGKQSFNPQLFLEMFGNYFGLGGSYESNTMSATKEKLTIYFEGVEGNYGMRTVLQNILEYLPKSSIEDSSIKNHIEVMCQNTLHFLHDSENPETKHAYILRSLELLKQGTPITFYSCWVEEESGDSHAINITMNNEFLFFINKGDKAADKPGMKKYRIPENKKIDYKILSTILDYGHPNNFVNAKGRSPLEELLNLEYIETISAPPQNVGNCGIANTRLCLKAALILLGNDESQKIFKACNQAAKLFWLETIFLLLEKQEPDEVLTQNLYFSILLVALKLRVKSSTTVVLEKLDEAKLDKEIGDTILQRIIPLKDQHAYSTIIFKLLNDKQNPEEIDYRALDENHYSLLKKERVRFRELYKCSRYR